MRPVKPLGVLLLLLGLPTLSWAQTSDHLYRSWRWAFGVTSPRAAGMAGAFVSVAEDSSAGLLNPAGLALAPEAELAASGQVQAGATLEGRDALGRDAGLAFLSASLPVGPRWALGAYESRSRSVRLSLDPRPLADGSVDSGSLEASVAESGLAVAWTATSRLRLGARLGLERLDLEGMSLRTSASGEEELRVTTDGSSDRVSLGVGVLFTPNETWQLGVAARSRATWGLDRRATRPGGGGLEPDRRYRIRSPDAVSAGVTYRPASPLQVVGQLDYVFYREIRSILLVPRGPTSPGDYGIDDGLEVRVGVEVTPFLCEFCVKSHLQLRAGVHFQSAGALAYRGPEASEAEAFPGTRSRRSWAVGASVGGGELAVLWGGERTVWLVGWRLHL